MAARLTYKGPEAIAYTLNAWGEKARELGRVTAREARKNLREPGPEPSDPGDFPKEQTRGLAFSVFSAYHKDLRTSRVGTTSLVARAMETGTVNMEPRPWLSKTIAQTMSLLMRVLTAGQKRPGTI
jgi:hypothetical protein